MGHKKTDAIDVQASDSVQDEIPMYGIKFDEDHTIAVDPEEIIICEITTGHSKAFTNVTLLIPAGDKVYEANI